VENYFGIDNVIFEPLDFIARLTALVPRARVHLTRYHGVLAPHSALRAAVTPAGRGQKTGITERSPAERHRAMSWARRLKRVFRIEIEQCDRCGGKVRIIASVEDPEVIGRILAHLERTQQARGSPADDTAASVRANSTRGFEITIRAAVNKLLRTVYLLKNAP
jgi:hypothetical protein